MEKLQYEPIFGNSWKSLKENMPLMVGLTLVYFFANMAVSQIPFFGFLFSLLVPAGYFFCLVQLRAGKDLSFQDFFWPFLDFNRFLHLLIYSIVQPLAIIFGFILLIIPGIYLSVSLSLGLVYFILRRQDAAVSFRSSIEMIKGNWWAMFGILILIVFINLLGLLCFGIGLLVSFPMSCLVLIEVLERLEVPVSTSPTSPSSNLNPLGPVY